MAGKKKDELKPPVPVNPISPRAIEGSQGYTAPVKKKKNIWAAQPQRTRDFEYIKRLSRVKSRYAADSESTLEEFLNDRRVKLQNRLKPTQYAIDVAERYDSMSRDEQVALQYDEKLGYVSVQEKNKREAQAAATVQAFNDYNADWAIAAPSIKRKALIKSARMTTLGPFGDADIDFSKALVKNPEFALATAMGLNDGKITKRQLQIINSAMELLETTRLIVSVPSNIAKEKIIDGLSENKRKAIFGLAEAVYNEYQNRMDDSAQTDQNPVIGFLGATVGLVLDGLTELNNLAQHFYRTQALAVQEGGIVSPLTAPLNVMKYWSETDTGSVGSKELKRMREQYGDKQVKLVREMFIASNQEDGFSNLLSKYANDEEALNILSQFMFEEVRTKEISELIKDYLTISNDDLGNIVANTLLPDDWRMQDNTAGGLVWDYTDMGVNFAGVWFGDPTLAAGKAIKGYKIMKYAFVRDTGLGNIEKILATPKVQRWIDNVALRIDDLNTAKTNAEAMVIREGIKRDFGNYLNDDAVDSLSKFFRETEKTFETSNDAFAAWMREADGVERLLMGRPVRATQILAPRMTRAKQAIIQRRLRNNKTISFDGADNYFINLVRDRVDENAVRAEFGLGPNDDIAKLVENPDFAQRMKQLEARIGAELLADITVQQDLVEMFGNKAIRKAKKQIFSTSAWQKRTDRFLRNFELAPMRDSIKIVDGSDADLFYLWARTTFSRTNASYLRELWISASEGQRRLMLESMFETIADAKNISPEARQVMFGEMRKSNKYALTQRRIEKGPDGIEETIPYDPSVVNGRTHALHAYQMRGEVPLPNFAEFQKLSDKVGVLEKIIGWSYRDGLTSLTNWWSTWNLIGPKYVQRNTLEDVTGFLLTGGRVGELLAGKVLTQSLREARGKTTGIVGETTRKLGTQVAKVIERQPKTIEVATQGAFKEVATTKGFSFNISLVRKTDDTNYNVIKAFDKESGEEIATFSWHFQDGTVGVVGVSEKFRRKGIATKLWDEANLLASKVDDIPKPVHAAHQTPSGKKWAEAVDVRVNASKLDDQVALTDETAIRRQLSKYFVFKHLSKEEILEARQALRAGNPKKLTELMSQAIVRNRISLAAVDFAQIFSKGKITRADILAAAKWFTSLGDNAVIVLDDTAELAGDLNNFAASQARLSVFGGILRRDLTGRTGVRKYDAKRNMSVKLSEDFQDITYAQNPELFHFYWYKNLHAILHSDGTIGQHVFRALLETDNIAKAKELAMPKIIESLRNNEFPVARSTMIEEVGIESFASRYFDDSAAYLAIRSSNKANKDLLYSLARQKDDGEIVGKLYLSKNTAGDVEDIVDIDYLKNNFGEDVIPMTVLGKIETRMMDKVTNTRTDRMWQRQSDAYARISREPVFWARFVSEHKALRNSLLDVYKAQGLSEVAAEKLVANLAVKRAEYLSTAFMDNPKVRSVAAFSLRNVARYYRATEDFGRRIIRTAKYNPEAIQKLNLLVGSMDDTGFTYTDENGDTYFVYPGSRTLHQVVLGLTNFLNPAEKVFTVSPFMFGGKTSMLTPSADPDAWLPTFSAPLSGLLVKTLNLFTPLDLDSVQSWLLGPKSVGKSGTISQKFVELLESVMPSHIRRAFQILPMDEISSQFANSVKSAMQIFVANGQLKPEELGTEKGRLDAVDSIRGISLSHLLLRFAFGFVVPASPQTLENTGISAELRALGIKNLRPGYLELVNKYEGDYEQAFAAWYKLYPKLSPFTVSKSGSNVIGLPPSTQEALDWYDSNMDFVKNYMYSSVFLAPGGGEFSPKAYRLLQSFGYSKGKDFEEMLYDVATAEDKYIYWLAKDSYDADIEAAATTAERNQIDERWAAFRDGMFAKNPLLKSQVLPKDLGGSVVARDEALAEMRKAIVEIENNSPQLKNKSFNKIKRMIASYDAGMADLAKFENGDSEFFRFKRKEIKENLNRALVNRAGDDEGATNFYERILRPLIEG